MSGYWIKIVAKALGIFLVGMLLVTVVRRVKGSVNHAINSSDPIPIPLIGLIPFRLDNDKLGSVSRVEFLRSDPEHVSGVRVVIKLADSVAPGSLGRCQIALDDVDHINDQTSFRCAKAGASLAGLEPFGVVAIKNSSDTFPLLLPAGAIAKLRATSFSFKHGKLDISGPPAAIDLVGLRTDSLSAEIAAQIEMQSDSIDTLKDLSSELEDSASEAPRDQRRALQRNADLVRGRMRLMVDLMKTNESRLHSLEKLSQLRGMRNDWKPVDGAHVADSVQEFVNAELQRVQAELERAGVHGVQVNVKLDEASVAAMREATAPVTASGNSTSVEAPAAANRGTPAKPNPPAKAAAPPKPAAAPRVEATP